MQNNEAFWNLEMGDAKSAHHLPFPDCRMPSSHKLLLYTILQNKRMWRCGVAPPSIIFERLELPEQLIYRLKGNISESQNHQNIGKIF